MGAHRTDTGGTVDDLPYVLLAVAIRYWGTDLVTVLSSKMSDDERERVRRLIRQFRKGTDSILVIPR